MAKTGAESGEAFVIWLDPAARRGHCTGRIEHVSTSERLHFASAEELVAFLIESVGGETPTECPPQVAPPAAG